MSNLKKEYELSVWTDIQNENGTFVEKRVAVIGSDKMNSLSRAHAPKLVKKVNGEKQLTFKMYSQYIDPINGEKVQNPFISLIDNETKIKLKYRGKWYDFIIKDIQEDSSAKTKSYTATDQFVIELSKNGYNLTLDTSLMNNSGNLQELGEAILKDTDWSVRVDKNPEQFLVEQLVEFETKNQNNETVTIYAFFSSCKDQPLRFQYVTDLGTKNSENIYDNPEQTYLDTKNIAYTTDNEAIKHGFSYPLGFTFKKITQYRASRKVYTHKSKLNPALNKIVYSYNDGAIEGYTVTDYITPNLITNLITNNTFKSTSGWTGSYMVNDGVADNQAATYRADVAAVAIDDNGNDLFTAFKEGTFLDSTTYIPCLKVKLKTAYSVLINSGFYDNRKTIKNLAPGQHFVLLYKDRSSNPAQFIAKIGVSDYSVNTGHYSPLESDKTFITFDSSKATYFSEERYEGYYYIIGTVPATYNITDEKSYKKLKTQMFLTGAAGSEYLFEDFQIFPYVEDNGKPLFPLNETVEAKEVNTYYYYNVSDNTQNPSAVGYRSSEQEYRYLTISETPSTQYQPVYTTDKVLSIDVKQSNYFNAIQSLSETFEVWADFDIEHNEDGSVKSKTIVFKENLENPNYVGFKYGVNLKQSKRTIDSKQIVTKLIVPDNTNEFAKNGFCSIARAGANTSGENYIFDFSYYYNFGKLNQDDMHEFFYRPKEAFDQDELQGYYVQLSEINNQLNDYIDRYAALAAPLMQAEANKQVAESGEEAAQEKYEQLAESFLKQTGYEHTNIGIGSRAEQVEARPALKSCLTEIAEYYSAWKKYSQDVITTSEAYEVYKKLNDDLLDKINELNAQKEELNKKFYNRFSRFIQEGTWKDDDYTDDDKYFADAVSTAANSALPKVTYSFSVIDLSHIPSYEYFSFELGDKTWVEDPDLFGEGREEVVITEITYELDEPEKTSIKIQNHKDQFASLFQKVTATTQSVQYAAGAWNKAADFAGANPVDQAAFLQGALSDAEMKLKNAGDQSVEWDKTGITVTDMLSPNEQIRIIGGAIMLRDSEGDGLGWKTAITARGINANVITTGQLNTGNIIIMNGDEPYFRWDTFGISAYYFNSDNPGGYLYGLDTTKGVRFDRFGIYGYKDKDGMVWHPNSIGDIEENSLFALTWDGLFFKLGFGSYNLGFDAVHEVEIPLSNIQHITTTQLGKAGKYIYNTWYNGYPSYDKNLENAPTFVKILSVGDSEKNEQLVIYDDGTLVAKSVKLTGSVEWVPEASPARSIYGTIDLMNHLAPEKWYYKDVPDHDPRIDRPADNYVGNPNAELNKCWHKIKGANDVLYCHTDTAGAVWDGPFLITGRSIKQTITEYSIQQNARDPSLIEEWDRAFPTNVNPGEYLYIRSYDEYDDGSKSSYRYSSSLHGSEAIQAYIECPLGNPISADTPDTTETYLTARMFRGNEELDADGSGYVYSWYKNNGLFIENGRTIELTVGDLRNSEFYFEAKAKSQS